MKSTCSGVISSGSDLALIRSHSRHAANVEPVIRLRLAIHEIQHHFFMIAKQRNEPASFTQRKQLVDHLPAFRPAIDAIAERNQRVIGLRPK